MCFCRALVGDSKIVGEPGRLWGGLHDDVLDIRGFEPRQERVTRPDEPCGQIPRDGKASDAALRCV